MFDLTIRLGLVGFKLAKSFSRHSTHLLCPSRSGAKFEKAQQWGVPVVDMSWLTDVATTGVIASTSAQTPHPGPDTVELAREPDNQAKVKRQDQDHPTVDITNSEHSCFPIMNARTDHDQMTCPLQNILFNFSLGVRPDLTARLETMITWCR